MSSGLEEATARAGAGKASGPGWAPLGSSQRSGLWPTGVALAWPSSPAAAVSPGPAVSGTPLLPTVMDSEQNIATAHTTPSQEENGSRQMEGTWGLAL